MNLNLNVKNVGLRKLYDMVVYSIHVNVKLLYNMFLEILNNELFQSLHPRAG